MMRGLQSVGESDEIRIGHRGNAERIGNTQGGPDIHCILAAAEARDTLLEARLFCLEGLGREGRRVLKKRHGGGTETRHAVVGKELRAADQAPVFAAHGAPDQPARPPIKPTTGTPARRASSNARMISAIASSPAFASCRRTPPVSNRITTGMEPMSRAARNKPVNLAPCTSPKAPPMKRPS